MFNLLLVPKLLPSAQWNPCVTSYLSCQIDCPSKFWIETIYILSHTEMT